uniref:Uncharacterized protein n=1 Tax=Eutreptiella gymnastica TaxID=73025 RepID=A0A7S1J950_9EUGL|mmetsp:Transcript_76556/g.135177  ORF Transcript_76556/g.135177 Transcript_76556/m.135177 type:complete len:230 (+) Transcript_76556:124-813(+)
MAAGGVGDDVITGLWKESDYWQKDFATPRTPERDLTQPRCRTDLFKVRREAAFQELNSKYSKVDVRKKAHVPSFKRKDASDYGCEVSHEALMNSRRLNHAAFSHFHPENEVSTFISPHRTRVPRSNLVSTMVAEKPNHVCPKVERCTSWSQTRLRPPRLHQHELSFKREAFAETLRQPHDEPLHSSFSKSGFFLPNNSKGLASLYRTTDLGTTVPSHYKDLSQRPPWQD